MAGAEREGEHEQPVTVLGSPRHPAPKRATHAAEQDREDVRTAREDWFAGQLDLDPDRLVFLDETGATPSMARRYGRAPRGERCRIAFPDGHGKTCMRLSLSSARCGLLGQDRGKA